MMHACAAVVSFLLVMSGCGSKEEDERPAAPATRVRGRAIVLKPNERAALDLAVEHAAEADLPDVRIRYGRVVTRPGDEIAVAAPFAGQITAVTSTTIGDAIVAKTSLATVTPLLGVAERAQLGVQAAELGGQIEQAERELALRETELVRAKDLAKSGIVSQAKLQEAETAVATATARVRATKQGRTAQAGATGRATELTAPVGGTLVALDAVVGGAVEQGRIVARIVRAGPRRIEVATSASDPSGAAYEVEVAGKWLAARLIARGTTVGVDGNRHDVLELDAGTEALVGSTVAVRLAAAQVRGIVVAETADGWGSGIGLGRVRGLHDAGDAVVAGDHGDLVL